MRRCLVTGSSGLVGSESVRFFLDKGYDVVGIDNDMRHYFFGSSTKEVQDELKTLDRYTHVDADIRNLHELEPLFNDMGSPPFEIVIHCAAQPSHDWAAKEPHTDFSINAMGTLNLLELTRLNCPKASFIFMSTNKVYGDRPNFHPDLREESTRYEVSTLSHGIDETMSIDACKHSIFGASKVAADVMVQEYGRYFGMNTVCFRGGCITGKQHCGAKLHGFLSYLVKCICEDRPYTIFGYKGKQVRDNIHAYDLVNAFWNYHMNPRPGEVYNMGGGRDNAVSVMEVIDMVNRKRGGVDKWDKYIYDEENRIGDHIWYISDLRKFKDHYPDWDITFKIEDIIHELVVN